MLDHIPQEIQALQDTGRCIWIGDHNAAVFFVIILRYQIKVVIQSRSLIWNLKQLCPDIIEGICNIRKQDWLFRIEKCHKRNGKYII